MAVVPAVSVEVREVPQPRPPTFCGGIGGYRAAAFGQPHELRIGDPLTLSLEISRDEGAVRSTLVSAPDLAANPSWRRTSRSSIAIPGGSQGNPNGSNMPSSEESGSIRFPPSRLPFRSRTESFVEIATRPVAVDVEEASRTGAGDLVGSGRGKRRA